MINPDEKSGKELLGNLKAKRTGLSFCVLGAGHGGLALAGHLAIMGYRVNLYNRSPERLEDIKWHGGVQVQGEVEGFGEIKVATCDIAQALNNVDVLMVAVPAVGHVFIARQCAPHLREGQIVVLNPGRTGGALEFRKILVDLGVNTKIFLAETQTFLYASRIVGPATSHIFRIKQAVPLATLPAYWIPDILAVFKDIFPQFVPGDNVLKTSLDNIGAVFHPALTLFNVAWIERTQGNFEFYLDGLSPSLGLILEAVDQERIAVAAGLGIRVHSARDWLYHTYGSVGENLYQAIQKTHSYRGIKAPDKINHRYIWEDVPTSLVPIASFGEMLKVNTPTIKAIINLASVLHQKDYWQEGRTVEKLGLAELSIKEIRELVVS